jgi:hypothetical protein
MEELGELNKEVESVIKATAKLVYHADGKTTSKSANDSKRNAKFAEIEMRSILIQFLVKRIFRKFSIELSAEDDDALREYYDEISSKGAFFRTLISHHMSLIADYPKITSQYRNLLPHDGEFLLVPQPPAL